jgi:hypothetical protein
VSGWLFKKKSITMHGNMNVMSSAVSTFPILVSGIITMVRLKIHKL